MCRLADCLVLTLTHVFFYAHAHAHHAHAHIRTHVYSGDAFAFALCNICNVQTGPENKVAQIKSAYYLRDITESEYDLILADPDLAESCRKLHVRIRKRTLPSQG